MIRINAKDEERLLDCHGVDNAGGIIYYYQGKPFTGIIESFDEHGNLVDESEFTDGHIGGVQRDYYANGQVKLEYYKYWGRIDKYFKEWDENGELTSYTIWDDGMKIKTVV